MASPDTSLSFYDAVASINRNRNTTTSPNWTLDKLSQSPAAVHMISDLLDRIGAGPIAATSLGGHVALVIPLTDHRVLRIVDSQAETKRPKDWKIWQPTVDAGSIDGFYVELYPTVKTLDKALSAGDIAPKKAAAMLTQLVGSFAKEGLFLWDCKPENFCVVTSQGKDYLFVLDAGGIASLSQMHGGQMGHDTHSYLDKFAAMMDATMTQLGVPDPAIKANPELYLKQLAALPSPAVDYEAIQKSYAQSLGLKHEESGVVTSPQPSTTHAAPSSYFTRNALLIGGIALAACLGLGAVLATNIGVSVLLAFVGTITLSGTIGALYYYDSQSTQANDAQHTPNIRDETLRAQDASKAISQSQSTDITITRNDFAARELQRRESQSQHHSVII